MMDPDTAPTTIEEMREYRDVVCEGLRTSAQVFPTIGTCYPADAHELLDAWLRAKHARAAELLEGHGCDDVSPAVDFVGPFRCYRAAFGSWTLRHMIALRARYGTLWVMEALTDLYADLLRLELEYDHEQEAWAVRTIMEAEQALEDFGELL